MTSTLPKLIGIGGKKQHGKDTLGKYLVERYGYTRISFADPLKEMIRPAFGFTEEQLYGSKKEDVDPFWKVSPRQVLQFVGTELFRDRMNELIPGIESNFWIVLAKKKIIEEWGKNPDAKFVITDLRFLGEMEFIREMKGYTICVHRPLGDEPIDLHSSETELDELKFDAVLSNNGSIDELYASLDSLF